MSFTEQIQALKDGETLSGRIYDITDVPGGWIFAHKEFKQLIFVPIPGINKDEVNIWSQRPINGDGSITVVDGNVYEHNCGWCNGTGKKDNTVCPHCNGQGKFEYAVSISK